MEFVFVLNIDFFCFLFCCSSLLTCRRRAQQLALRDAMIDELRAKLARPNVEERQVSVFVAQLMLFVTLLTVSDFSNLLCSNWRFVTQRLMNWFVGRSLLFIFLR
jgi:hypothetical protein